MDHTMYNVNLNGQQELIRCEYLINSFEVVAMWLVDKFNQVCVGTTETIKV